MPNTLVHPDSTKQTRTGNYSLNLTGSSQNFLKLENLMNRDVVTITPEQSVFSASKKMSKKNVSCIVVLNGTDVTGILTEKDIVNLLARGEKSYGKIKVAQVMSSPVESVTPDFSVIDAAALMENKNIKRLPIVKDNQLTGIVTQTDLTRAFTSHFIWKDVTDIMKMDVAVVPSKATVAEAIEKMCNFNISCVVAIKANQVNGIITERDILNKIMSLQKDPAATKVEQIMSAPVVTISPGLSVFSAQRLMEQMHIRRLVVMQDGNLCGVLTQTDILKAIKMKLREDGQSSLRLMELRRASMLTLDLKDRITFVSPTFVKLFEINEPAELIGRPFLPERFWVNPQERTECLNQLKKGDVENKELEMKTSKGKKIYVNFYSTFIRNIHGSIEGIQAILYDITTEKEIEQWLRFSEERYRSITEDVLDSSGVGIFILDRAFRVVWINHAAELYFGIKREKIIGRDKKQLIKRKIKFIFEDKNGFAKTVLDTYKNNNYAESFECHILPDGERQERWLEHKSKPIYSGLYAGGRIEHYYDITLRKKAKQSLEQSAKELRATIDIINKSPTVVFLWKNAKGWPVEKATKNVEKLLGYTAAEFTAGKLCYADLVHPDDLKTVSDKLFTDSNKEKNNKPRQEYRIVAKGGKTKWVTNWIWTRKNNEGAITHYQGIVTDITMRKLAMQDASRNYKQLKKAHDDLKHMQSQMLQNEKLASIGQLAAGVAHEMNTPVGFVTSNFYTLKEYVDKIQKLLSKYGELAEKSKSSENPQLQTILKDINQFRNDAKLGFILEDINGLLEESTEGLERVTGVVQNLRDFSRVDQQDSHDEYDLNKAIEATLIVARNEIKYDADVHTELTPLPLICCHSGKINQVLLNILVNAAHAIKFQDRHEKGKITVRTYPSDNYVVCEICDDGPGIPDNIVSRIFEPFFTTKPVGKGTGLGLSVSHDIIVNKHNGQLLVDSNVGKGTKFTIKLPINSKNDPKGGK